MQNSVRVPIGGEDTVEKDEMVLLTSLGTGLAKNPTINF